MRRRTLVLIVVLISVLGGVALRLSLAGQAPPTGSLFIIGENGVGVAVAPGNTLDVLTSAGPDQPPTFVPPAIVVNPGFPADSVLFFSIVDTDPHDLIGIGTWELVKHGKLLFSDDALECWLWKRTS